jgi:hypothetical protein
MALNPIIETDSGSAEDITSAAIIGSFSPSSDREIAVRLKLSSLNAAAATFTVAVVDSNGDALAAYSMGKFEAADTVAYLHFDAMLIKSAETVSVSILSDNASDSSVTWAIDWIDAHRVDVHELAGGQYKIANTSGNWETAGTWSDGVVPAAGDNIIIRNGVTVTVAASPTPDLGAFGTLELQGSGSLQIASGQTVDVVPAGWVVEINSGTITLNNGTIITNNGTVTTNNGTVASNTATLGTNNASGVIGFSTGTVTMNKGTIGIAVGTVTTNNSGTINFNIGTITTNNSGAVVQHNYGTIGTDDGSSDVPLVATTTVNTDLAALFAGITLVAEWLGALAGKQTANATALTEMRATGAGSGTYNEATDSQEAIADNVINAGTGARTVTITVTDGTDPLENAKVRLVEGVQTWLLETNTSGIATFNLDDATYTVSITKAGYTFSGTTLVVNGTEAETYAMTAISFTPSAADQVTGFYYAYDENGDVEEGVTIYWRITADGQATGFAYDNTTNSAESASDGLVQLVGLFKGATYQIRRGTVGKWESVTIASDATSPLELNSIIGNP